MSFLDKVIHAAEKVKKAFVKEANVVGPELYNGTTVTLGALDIISSPEDAAKLLVYVETQKPSGKDLLHMLDVAGSHDIKNPVFLMNLAVGLYFIILPEEGETIKILEEIGTAEIGGLEANGISYSFDDEVSTNIVGKDSLYDNNGKYSLNKDFDSDDKYEEAAFRGQDSEEF